MSCRVIDVGGGVTGFVCSRGPARKAPPCQYCKVAPSVYLCDAELRGKKAGKTCDGKICERCATLVAPNVHWCPSHRREHDAKIAAADAWLDAVDLAQIPSVVCTREVTASQAAVVPGEDIDRVDEVALARMFPDWDPTNGTAWFGDHDGPAVNPIAGEIRQTMTPREYDLSPCPVCKSDEPRLVHHLGWIICERSDCGHEESIKSPPKPASIAQKVAHVRAATQDRKHGCHWPGCKAQCKPAYWGCREHWYALPSHIRDRIWRTYAPGQEQTMSPSRDYVEAANEAQRWIQKFIADAGNGGEKRRTSWEEATRDARSRDRARVYREHPDPAAEAEASWAGDMSESEFDR